MQVSETIAVYGCFENARKQGCQNLQLIRIIDLNAYNLSGFYRDKRHTDFKLTPEKNEFTKESILPDLLVRLRSVALEYLP